MRFCVLGRPCLKVCLDSDSICWFTMKNEAKNDMKYYWFIHNFCETEHELGNNVGLETLWIKLYMNIIHLFNNNNLSNSHCLLILHPYFCTV